MFYFCLYSVLLILLANSIIAQTTVVTEEGFTATLPCNTSIFPEWNGPSPNGIITYNLEGLSGFTNPKLGSKAARLKWGANNGDLIITNVVKAEDEGQYTCIATSVYPLVTKALKLEVLSINGKRRLVVDY